MVYICTKAEDIEINNQWIVDNLDPNGINTFVINRQDVNNNQFCLISLPNNGSDFVEGMKDHFGYKNRIDASLTGLSSLNNS